MKRNKRPASPSSQQVEGPVVGLRIIGGSLRGRKLQYSGDLRTRPMKDRVREAMFNLLGPAVAGCHAIDLFAGTGALGLEAISRGAARATFIERHLPTARVIEQNAAALGVRDKTQVVFGDAFLWSRKYQPASGERLVVFCSPPFDFYANRQPEMLELIARWITAAPPGSHLAVEAVESFDVQLLPGGDAWNTRVYAPAVVAILST